MTGLKTLTIAIDGPAASGKGTLARRIARHYGLGYLDTGALYRAVARDVRKRGETLSDPIAAARAAQALDAATLDDPALREPGAGEAASIVASIPEVRQALLDFQRRFAGEGAGAVLDGRDIGTVVLPDASVKIFVVADAEVRARRRYLELKDRGEAVTFETILGLVKARDERDMGRSAAPLARAADAHLLDTTHLDIEAAFDAAVGLIERTIGH